MPSSLRNSRTSLRLALAVGWIGTAAACFSGGGSSPSRDAGREASCLPSAACEGGACDASTACSAGVGGSGGRGASSGSGGSTSGSSSGASSGSSGASSTSSGSSGAGSADAQFNGSVCAGVNMVPSWSGTLTLDYTDQATAVGPVSVAHSFRASFTLLRDPAALPGQVTVNYAGKPTGTGTLDESLTTASTTETNQGSGALSSVGNMVLTIDGDTCTFHFQWEWAIGATITINGSGTSANPEDVGGLLSKDVPLGDWKAGIAYSAGFPTHGMLGGTGLVPDYYALVSALGFYLFFNDMAAARGPAPVAFAASPNQ